MHPGARERLVSVNERNKCIVCHYSKALSRKKADSGQLQSEELARKVLINFIEAKSEPGIPGLKAKTKVPPLPPEVQNFLSQRCQLSR